jgi:cytochrome o ubiquinol oxidase subunit 1
MVWHMWWLAALGLFVVIGGAIVHSFNEDRDFHIPASDVIAVEGERTEALRNVA